MRKEQVPLLLTLHGEQYEKQSFYSLLENRYQTASLPILENKWIVGSAYGWLVLLEPLGADCCLWHPASMEIIELPELDYPHLHNRCVLSKPPTEPDCTVVFNFSCTMEQSICRVGDDEFVKLSSEEKGYGLLAMASFQGEIYGIVNRGYEFVTIRFVGETVELRPLLIDGERPWKVPQPRRGWVTLTNDYLIELPCGNELLLVTKMFSGCYLNDGVEFRVFRVDVGGMECEEIENLDGHTVFISYCGNGFCCSSFGAGTKPNSIYYTNRKGRVMYVYDLDDRSTTELLPCPATGRSVNYWIHIPPDILQS